MHKHSYSHLFASCKLQLISRFKLTGQAAKKSRVALHFHFMVTLGRGSGGSREGGVQGYGSRYRADSHTLTHTHGVEEVQLIERLAQLAVAPLLGTWSS